MRKLMKALGFLSVLATVSDVSGMTAFHSTLSNGDTGSNTIVSEDVLPANTKKSRRPVSDVPDDTDAKSETQPVAEPALHLSSDSTLFRDIVKERELFNRFDFGGRDNDDFLCGVNREVRKNRVGLIILEPSGIIKTLLIDRDTLKVVQQTASIPRKEQRDEFSRHGMFIADACLIARQVAGVREPDKNGAAEGSNAGKDKMKLTKMRTEVLKNPDLSSLRGDEILERFRKDIQDFNSENPKRQEMKK